MNESIQQRLEHSLKVLEIGPSESWEDIEKQYRQLIQRWHPDRNSGDAVEQAQNKFIEINSAFKTVREHYRKTGGIPRPIPPEQQESLLGVKKQTSPVMSLLKNKLAITIAVGFITLATFGGLLWSLDARLTANNRDRAELQKADSSKVDNLRQNTAKTDNKSAFAEE